MKNLLKKLLSSVNGLLKTRKIFYYIPGKYSSFGYTAVKTKFGFWYVGNVLDQNDIACGILNNGLVEPEETNLVLKIFEYLKNKDSVNIIDVGANTGYYSFLAADFFGEKARIYSFEPVAEFVDCMNESIKINRFEKSIAIYDVALSDVNGKSEIYVSGTCSSLEKDFNKDRSLPQRSIVTRKLDDIVNEKNIKMDFIKMDIEGHELKALKGGIKSIRQQKPILFVEITQTFRAHNFINDNYWQTIDTLLGLGYAAYRLNKNNVLEKIQKDGHVDGIYMYLFLDEKKHAKLANILHL